MDADLRSIQEARDLVSRAAEAQRSFGRADQKTVDAIVTAAARAASAPEMPNGGYDVAALEKAKVVDLRDMARRVPNFPLKGRDVARASREELLAAFRSLSR